MEKCTGFLSYIILYTDLKKKIGMMYASAIVFAISNSISALDTSISRR